MMSLLECVKAKGTPLINGNRVTFLWEGPTQPQLLGDFNYWLMDKKPIDFEQVSEDQWQTTITLPLDAYIEYGFIVDGERTYDPLNPNRFDDNMGHINSVFWMPQAHDNPLAIEQADVPRGQITTHVIDGKSYIVGASRTLHLYRPAINEPTPLLIVFDGSGYLHHARIATIVDNLITQKRIRPISLALLDPGGDGHVVEYASSDATVGFLIYCVLPFAREHLHLVDTQKSPGAFGMMGASMGGLMSLYTALRAPEIFGHVLSQSGAFRGEHLYYRSVTHDLLEYTPTKDIKIWMDAGIHEWFIDGNREMNALLQKRGYDVIYSEHNSGHNYPSWRNSLWRGLEHLFPLISAV